MPNGDKKNKKWVNGIQYKKEENIFGDEKLDEK